MGAFSVNQARHLYVVNSLGTSNTLATQDKAVGYATLNKTTENEIFLSYRGVDGVLRSDLINIDNILYVKGTTAEDMAYPLKRFTVTLSQDIFAGQDYILRVAFKQYIGMSDEDQYFKYGMAHANASSTASSLYRDLALSLAKNFGKEPTPLVQISLQTSSSTVPVTSTTKESELAGTYTGVILDELPQPWRRGVLAQVPVYFDVYPGTINANGDEVVWGSVVKSEPTNIANGKKIADLEYFCMGERGDIYRSIGFPHNIVTEYLVDETKSYDVVDIHYYYVGGNENPQKSEKTITLVGVADGPMENIVTQLGTLGVPASKINSNITGAG